jgi:hypothetical protein
MERIKILCIGGERVKKITEVIATVDYQVTINFDNNESLVLDMKGKLHTARFSDLKDATRFTAAKTDGRSISWPGGISLSISELLEIADA